MKNLFFTLVALLAAAVWNTSRAQTDYGLQIAGIQVTSDNAPNITGTGIQGSISYDNATKTLTLNKAIIDASDGKVCIKNTGIDGLSINLIGKNTLKAKNYGGKGVSIEANTTITGSGSLNAICSNDAGIKIKDKTTLTITDCTIDIVGTWGITGFDGKNDEKLILNNATVSATGSKSGSITALAVLTMNNCYIKEPTNAFFNNTKHTVEANGETVTEEVKIVQGKGAVYYGIRVADVYINSENAANITSSSVTGKVSYDNDTKTLTLDNATITTTIRGIFNEGIQGLTVKLIGTNKITASSPNATGISAYMSLSITGTGSLSIHSEKHSGIYINSAVTLKDCNIDIVGYWGISGFDGTEGETLVIDNSTVKVKGDRGSICDLSKFTLIASEITKPQGAVWSDEKKCLVLNDNKITDEVIISPKSTGIPTSLTNNGIRLWSDKGTLYISTDNAISTSKAQIFHINGQAVGTVVINNNKTAINLPAGIYVVRIGNTSEKIIVR